MKKKVLVTGGAGFIGSNLCRTLLDSGDEVCAVDNLITGKIENLIPLFGDRNFHFFGMDITHPVFLDIFSGISLDQVYHLACPTGVPNIKILGEEMILACSTGTLNVMEISRLHGAKTVYSSSAEIYGQPEKTPQEENYNGNVNPVGARSAYEEGKRFSESIVKMYVDKYDIDADIVRIFNTYGPGMSLSDQRVIPQFLQNISAGRELTIFGDGSQTRTLLYVDDLIRGIMLVMERGGQGEIYNIGGDEQISIKNLAKMTKRLTGCTGNIAYAPHFIEDHSHRQPSVERIKRLGWQPEISLEDGLARMIEANGIKPADTKIEALCPEIELSIPADGLRKKSG